MENDMSGINVNTSLINTMLVSTSLSASAETASCSVSVSSTGKASSAGSVSTVSTLARLLADAATRAEATNASLSPKAQAERKNNILAQFTAEAYNAEKGARDIEVPQGADAERQAQAQQATQYINSRLSGAGARDTPFGSLSAEQLSLIAYDEDGNFTINERHAALLNLQDREQAARLKEAAVQTSPATNQPGGKGYQIMLERLFGGKETLPISGVGGYSLNNIGRSNLEFLTRDDRAILAEMYDYAQSQGADLKYVDEIANVLGDYRRLNNGKTLIYYNNGNAYDSQGRRQTVSFDDETAAVADRILNGAAINSTRIDQGFLRFQLDPGYGALSTTYDPEFLEQMVIHLSGEAATQPPLDSRFSVYVSGHNEHYVMHVSDEVILPPFEPDIMKIDGKWIITEKGRANGITMEDVLGKNAPRDQVAKANEDSIRYLLELSFNKGDGEDTRPEWLKNLLAVLKETQENNSSGITAFTPKRIDGRDYLFSEN